jgi:hypothetical protein
MSAPESSSSPHSLPCDADPQACRSARQGPCRGVTDSEHTACATRSRRRWATEPPHCLPQSVASLPHPPIKAVTSEPAISRGGAASSPPRGPTIGCHTVVCALLGVSLAWFYKRLGRAQGPSGERAAHGLGPSSRRPERIPPTGRRRLGASAPHHVSRSARHPPTWEPVNASPRSGRRQRNDPPASRVQRGLDAERLTR